MSKRIFVSSCASLPRSGRSSLKGLSFSSDRLRFPVTEEMVVDSGRDCSGTSVKLDIFRWTLRCDANGGSRDDEDDGKNETKMDDSKFAAWKTTLKRVTSPHSS